MYLNPFSLEIMFEMVDTLLVKNLWKCLPLDFYNFMSNDVNFRQLNELDLKFRKCNKIVAVRLDDKANLEEMRNYFKKYYFVHQMSFAKIFANFYLRKTKNSAGLPKRYELTFR